MTTQAPCETDGDIVAGSRILKKMKKGRKCGNLEPRSLVDKAEGDIRDQERRFTMEFWFRFLNICLVVYL